MCKIVGFSVLLKNILSRMHFASFLFDNSIDHGSQFIFNQHRILSPTRYIRCRVSFPKKLTSKTKNHSLLFGREHIFVVFSLLLFTIPILFIQTLHIDIIVNTKFIIEKTKTDQTQAASPDVWYPPVEK